MNLIEFTNYLINSLKYMITTFVEVLKLINPANIDKVFKNMKVGTPGMVSLYLIITAIPLFAGYFFYLYLFQIHPYSFENSIKVAARYYLMGLIAPMSMAMPCTCLIRGSSKEKSPMQRRSVCLPMRFSPGLLGGFFRIIDGDHLSYTYLLLMYAIYLTFCRNSRPVRRRRHHISIPFSDTYRGAMQYGYVCSRYSSIRHTAGVLLAYLITDT